MPNLRNNDSDSDDDLPSIPRLKGPGQKRAGNKKSKKLLAITDGRADDDDSNGSMPDLQSVSDSSDENDDDLYVSENEEEEGDEDDDDTAYDSEDEELHRTMLREAMDAAMATPEFFDPKSTVPEFDTLAEERKGNPFLKLLGSLRGKVTKLYIPELHALIPIIGRMFSSDPKLSSTTRAEPRKGLFRQKGETAAKTPAKQAPAPAPRPKTSDASGSKVSSVQPAPSKEHQPGMWKRLERY